MLEGLRGKLKKFQGKFQIWKDKNQGGRMKLLLGKKVSSEISLISSSSTTPGSFGSVDKVRVCYQTIEN
ncbi:hypothetical protein LWI29_002891 [Acer saccharum]|uniref:Uncharacterized protein n=1 Tax=Acer saccharum TaxID=4024 RepID=A0AA39T6X2_ACESA|nr:hypothetical protein LWI29_002891 [Acer saccharum]